VATGILSEGEIAPVAEELDREHRFPYEIVSELAELGLMGIPIPEEYGGGGGGIARMIVGLAVVIGVSIGYFT
jgi:alkylation response protein AidB-like acyl-CoA dehydrogenase